MLAWSHVLAVAMVLGMSGLLVWFFVDLGFYVYEARIGGTVLTHVEEVYRISKLHEQSIFYVNPREVAERIGTALPGVRHVEVKCGLPNVVAIQIEEQEVRFLWRAAQQSVLVDGSGYVLSVDDGMHESSVSIVDVDSRTLKPGDQVPVMAIRTIEGLRRLLPEIMTFRYSDAEGISLQDARGWSIIFGDAESLPEKVASMRALLQRIASRNESVELIDLRFVGSPYYR